MKRIGFIGGPMSGKTSLIKEVSKKLSEEGYFPIIIEEIPTSLLQLGLVPDKSCSRIEFQKEVLVGYGIAYERVKYLNTMYFSKLKNYDKYIILYDTLPRCGYGYLTNEEEKNELDEAYGKLIDGGYLTPEEMKLDYVVFCDTVNTDNFSSGNDYRVEKSISRIEEIASKIKNEYIDEINITLGDIGLEKRVEKIIKEIKALY